MDEHMMESVTPHDAELHQLSPLGDDDGPAVPAFEEFELGGLSDAPPRAHSLDAVQDVPVKVQAVLGRSRMPIGELLRLQTGMVVELDRRVGEPVDIFVNNRLIARGEVVMIDNSLGVTLTEIVQAER
jgi:flagellar motor switch protein FliN/FliY